MTPNRRLLTSIALSTVAAVCISALGCGDQGGGKTKSTVESTVKKVETSGTDKKPSTDGVKVEKKIETKIETKSEVKKDDAPKETKSEVKTEVIKKEEVKKEETKPADDKANGAEAGSSTVPGGGVETPQ